VSQRPFGWRIVGEQARPGTSGEGVDEQVREPEQNWLGKQVWPSDTVDAQCGAAIPFSSQRKPLSKFLASSPVDDSCWALGISGAWVAKAVNPIV
jgi:hypothetical protein